MPKFKNIKFVILSVTVALLIFISTQNISTYFNELNIEAQTTNWVSWYTDRNDNVVNVYIMDFIPRAGTTSYVDSNISGLSRVSINSVRNAIKTSNIEAAKILAEGTAYHKYPKAPYGNKSAKSYLKYNLAGRVEFLTAIPLRTTPTPYSNSEFYPDTQTILTKNISVCDLVDKYGIDEIWINMYHTTKTVPIESNLSMGTNIRKLWNQNGYGDTSNSFLENDLPQCQNTYTVYNYNYSRAFIQKDFTETIVHNHIHQIERYLKLALGTNNTTDLTYDSFTRNGERSLEFVCGDAHFTPISKAQTDEYKYNVPYSVTSKCPFLTWNQTASKTVTVKCSDWGCREKDYYVWWMNSLPGENNNLSKNGLIVKNFWRMISNFDGNASDSVTNCTFGIIRNAQANTFTKCSLK